MRQERVKRKNKYNKRVQSHRNNTRDLKKKNSFHRYGMLTKKRAGNVTKSQATILNYRL